MQNDRPHQIDTCRGRTLKFYRGTSMTMMTSSTFVNRSHPDRIQVKDSRLVWQNCGPPQIILTAEQAHVVYRHHSHHQAPDTMIRSSNAFGVLIIIFPFPLTAYQGVLNSRSRHLSRVYHPASAQRAHIQHDDHLDPLVFRSFERSTCPLRDSRWGFGGCGEGGRSEGWTGAGESEWVE